MALPSLATQAAVKVIDDAAQVNDQLCFLATNTLGDSMKPQVMTRALRDDPERPLLGTDLPTPTTNPMDAWGLPIRMAACVREAVASPTSDRIPHIDIPATPTTTRTLEPWPIDTIHRRVPRQRNLGSTDPNIGPPSGELAVFLTPLKPRRRTLDQCAALQ
jgi:hypothetical protein